MKDIFLDAIVDTLKLLPWLLLMYVIIELLEHKTKLTGPNNRLNGKLGPLIGSATGLIPQCGFSVMAAKLYEQKYVTLGTLLAIFLSTSDEAFVILLSSGRGAVYLLPLIAVKIAVGIAAGYACDGLMKLIRGRQVCVESSSGPLYDRTKELFFHRTEEEMECTSCGRTHDEKRPLRTYFVSPLLHALKVAAFILAVNLALGIIIYFVTEERFTQFMARGRYVQPLITSLIGLIPNCASSVVITESFLQGGIAFGSCVAGLCANSGLGFVVLLRNVRMWKRNLGLIVACYAISVVVGILLNAVLPI